MNDATSSQHPPMPSLEFLVEVARQERDEQRAHFDSLDTKAGIVLAFDGILIPLTLQVGAAARVVAVALGVTSAWFALIAFWPRKFPVLNAGRLRNYLTHSLDDARLVVHDTSIEMIKKTQAVLGKKGRRLKFSLIALFAAAVTLGVGVIFVPSSGGQDEQSRQQRPASQSPSPERAGRATGTPASAPTITSRP